MQKSRMTLFPEKERIQLHPAYILHQRPYRNTSLILDVLTEKYGRISLVAKGAKQSRSQFRGCLQPFQRLSISWVRKTELGTLTHAELTQNSPDLFGEVMYAAMYLNELLVRVSLKSDINLDIFEPYQKAINQLSESNIAPILRVFEYALLQSLGFEIQLTNDAEHNSIQGELFYKFIPEHGFVVSNEKHVLLFEGKHLIAFNDNKLESKEAQKSAQRLMQIGLKPLLGNKPLNSRELYKSYISMTKP